MVTDRKNKTDKTDVNLSNNPPDNIKKNTYPNNAALIKIQIKLNFLFFIFNTFNFTIKKGGLVTTIIHYKLLFLYQL